MDTVWRIVTLISSALTVAATIAMVLTFRRERRIGAGSLLLAIAISAGMLLAFTLISGVSANSLLAGLALVVGLLIGIVRGFATGLYYRGGQVVGRNSILFLLGWGGSFALTQLLTLLGSALAASSGLLLLCLSTGTQVGLNGNLLLRRMVMHPPAPARPPGSVPERSIPPPSLPERG